MNAALSSSKVSVAETNVPLCAWATADPCFRLGSVVVYSPTPVITWKKLSGQLPPRSRFSLSMSNSKATITQLESSDAGTYGTVTGLPVSSKSEIKLIVEGNWPTSIKHVEIRLNLVYLYCSALQHCSHMIYMISTLFCVYKSFLIYFGCLYCISE